LSKEKLFAMLSSVKNGKSPDIDGLPCEFFKVMWYLFGDDLCRMANEAFSFG
jgi:hypothetical protein